MCVRVYMYVYMRICVYPCNIHVFCVCSSKRWHWGPPLLFSTFIFLMGLLLNMMVIDWSGWPARESWGLCVTPSTRVTDRLCQAEPLKHGSGILAPHACLAGASNWRNDLLSPCSCFWGKFSVYPRLSWLTCQVRLGLALNSWPSHLSLLSPGIEGIFHKCCVTYILKSFYVPKWPPSSQVQFVKDACSFFVQCVTGRVTACDDKRLIKDFVRRPHINSSRERNLS